MFQQYEAELQEVLADAEARLGALLAAADTADRSGAVRQLNDLVRTARDLEKQIDVEVRSAAPDARAAFETPSGCSARGGRRIVQKRRACCHRHPCVF